MVKGIEYNVQTGIQREIEIDIVLPNPRISEINYRLQMIKIELSMTDFKAIQFGEGVLPSEAYEPIKQKRIALREEFNALETELENLLNID